MTPPELITEDTLWDYLDGRLSDRRRAEVAAYLQENPAKAVEIESQRLRDDALRSLGADILEEPVPQRLTAVLRKAEEDFDKVHYLKARHHGFTMPRLVEIAAALFIFVLGGTLGWTGHGQLQRGPSEIDRVLADASFAFATFANDDRGFFDFGPDQDEELTAFAERVFSRPLSRPSLDDLGLQYRGARILPNTRRLVSYFLFENENGDRISVTVWPSDLPPNPTVVTSKMDDIQARFWLEDQVGFAVMGRGDDAFMDQVTEEVFAYYTQPTGQ